MNHNTLSCVYHGKGEGAICPLAFNFKEPRGATVVINKDPLNYVSNFMFSKTWNIHYVPDVRGTGNLQLYRQVPSWKQPSISET